MERKKSLLIFVRKNLGLICKLACFSFAFSVLSLSVTAQVQHYKINIRSTEDSSSVPDVSFSVNYIDNGNNKSASGFSDAYGFMEFDASSPFSMLLHKAGFHLKKFDFENNAPSKIYFNPLKVKLETAEVSTAQTTTKPADESLYKVKVIDQKQINLQGATNLTDLLATQMNVRVSQDPVLGGGLSLAGLSGQNVKILVDGIPVIGRENGNIDISQINLNNVERVEIIEGPLSSVYGADALGGVINLITKYKEGNIFSAGINSKYETVGTYNVDGNVSFNKKNHHTFFYGGRNFFDGYSPIEQQREELWNPKEQYFAGLGYAYSFRKSEVRFKTDWLNENVFDLHNPIITPYEAYSIDDVYESNRWNTSVFLDNKFSDKTKLSSLVSYSFYDRFHHTYYKDFVTLSNESLNNASGEQHSQFNAWNVRSVYSDSKGKKFTWQSGIDLNYETGGGTKIKDDFQTMADYAVFAWGEYKPIRQLQIRPAVRIAYNTRYNEVIVPSFNFKYDFKQNTSVRWSIAKGYRAPSLKELDIYFVDANHNIIGNENLLPENSINYQLSVEHKHYFETTVLKLEPSIFYNDIKNMILLAMVDEKTQMYSYINSGTFKNYGYGLNGSLQSNVLKFEAGFYTIASYNILSEKYDVPSFLGTPEYRLALSFFNKKQTFSAGVFMKYNGEAKAFALNANGETYLTKMDAYTLLDVTFSKSFLHKHISINGGVKNILGVTNVDNAIASSTPHGNNYSSPVAMGRNIFVGLSLQLSKQEDKR